MSIKPCGSLTLGVRYVLNAQALQTGTRLEHVAVLDAARERHIARRALRHYQRIVEEEETDHLQVRVGAQLGADDVSGRLEVGGVQVAQQVAVRLKQRLKHRSHSDAINIQRSNSQANALYTA